MFVEATRPTKGRSRVADDQLANPKEISPEMRSREEVLASDVDTIICTSKEEVRQKWRREWLQAVAGSTPFGFTPTLMRAEKVAKSLSHETDPEDYIKTALEYTREVINVMVDRLMDECVAREDVEEDCKRLLRGTT